MRTNRQLRKAELRRLRKQLAPHAPSPSLTPGNPAPEISAPPVSQARLDANRENAAHSSGPRSPQGKQTSSRNAVRHGLTGNFHLLPDESAADFRQLSEEWLDSLLPSSPLETSLVEDMVRHHWLAQRALRLQTQCLSGDPNSPLALRQLEVYLRYQTTHQRAFHRCRAELIRLKNERQRSVKDTVESRRREERHQLAMSRGRAAETRHAAAEARREAAEIHRGYQREHEIFNWSTTLKIKLGFVSQKPVAPPQPPPAL